MVKILQNPHKILRTKAEPVSGNQFGTKELSKMVRDMKHTLAGQDDGVAIAAPQIGIAKRIFVVSHKVFQNYDEEGKPLPPILSTDHDRVFINPEIVNLSKTKKSMEEGCLSVRPWYGQVKRATKARVRAQDENGKIFELGGSGLMAQIFQHEIDHLDGILFVDKATDLYEHNPEHDEHIA